MYKTGNYQLLMHIGGKVMTSRNKLDKLKEKKVINDHKELTKLLLQYPGVKDFMEVYKTWEKFDSVHQTQRGIIAIKRIVALSDTSSNDLT